MNRWLWLPIILAGLWAAHQFLIGLVKHDGPRSMRPGTKLRAKSADDLTVILGVSAAGAKLLHQAGYWRYEDIATAVPQDLRRAFAGKPLPKHIDTWPTQTRLAQKEEWAKLEKLHSSLNSRSTKTKS